MQSQKGAVVVVWCGLYLRNHGMGRSNLRITVFIIQPKHMIALKPRLRHMRVQ
jgi:hypothetical protein